MTAKIFKLPEWTKRLPNNAYLNQKEMCEILGYKQQVNSKAINKKIGLDELGFSKSSMDARAPKQFRKSMWRIGELRKIEGKEI
jgi:hypothetical protein